jgi:hypothetical protein
MGNDASFAQPRDNSIAYITRQSVNPQWISSFTNSNIFVSPKIELLTCPDSPINCWMSVNNLNNNEILEIYPNPTNGALNISFSRGLGAYELNLIDALGQKIKSHRFQAKGPHIESMDLSSYTPGLYQLQIITEGGQVGVFKINVQ